MATVLPSVTVRTCRLNCGAIKLPFLATTPWHSDRNEGISNVKQTSRLRSRTCTRSIDIRNAQKRHGMRFFAAKQNSVEHMGPSLHASSKNEVLQREFSYLFRTEIGGLVKVTVGAKNMKYAVFIEVSSMSQCSSENKLVLSWGMFRSDSSCLVVPELQTSASHISQFTSETKLDLVRTPFIQNSSGRYSLELEFDSSQAPFYLPFQLYSSFDDPANVSEIRTHRKTKFCVPVGIGPGSPTPLGVSFCDDGSVNFSLFSRNAKSVVLCLYDDMTNKPSLEIDLDPYINRMGDIWHVSLENVGNYVSYGYQCKGDWDEGNRSHTCHVLLDPYAKVLGSFFPDHGESVSLSKCLGCLQKEPSFDWSGDNHPYLPMENLVVYRLNVGQFTRDDSSHLPKNIAGTFAGLAEKVHHFQNLGVNAILLEPIFPFDEKKGPYFPYNFFSPMNIYGPKQEGVSSINSVKEMVKALHANGIEVLLEVIFTHTAEVGDAACQSISFRGIDNSSYYIVDGDIGAGANNALNCNSPIVQQMILDSLRHWVIEFHIDGFCFVNASSFVQGPNGYGLPRPPLIEAIAFDPLLSKTKIIADCWSPLDMSYSEIDFPHWKRWAEMNSRFCNDVRNFLRGEGLLSDLATRLCGSGDVFSDSRGPAFSFNFIAKNFGLPLVDLVSFSGNELSSELSWNCGEEGPTSNNAVLEKRIRQIHNFLFVLFISLGVPVLNMGDECGHSAGGSRLYDDRRPFDWNYLRTGFGVQITQFIAFLSSLRIRRNDLLRRRTFLKVENIDWHGHDLSEPKWDDPSCKFLAVTLKPEKDEKLSNSDKGDMFIVFNASDLTSTAILPQLSEGSMWFRLVDTALPFPEFFSINGDPDFDQSSGLTTYELKPHSCALFEVKIGSI